MASERWQHHNVTSTQRLVGLLVKSVDFSHLCCIVSLVTFKKGETFQVFFSKVCMPITHEVLNIS